MAKKRRPKEIIEKEAKKDKGEYAFMKFSGKELIPVILKSGESEGELDEKLIEKFEKMYGKKWNRLHTHPYNPDTTMYALGKKLSNTKVSPDIPLPSDDDLMGFLEKPDAKHDYIAQYNTKTGKVEGYFVISKTRKTPKTGAEYLEDYAKERVKGDKGSILKMIYNLGKSAISILGTNKKVDKYGEKVAWGVINDSPEEIIDALKKISKKYHLKYHFLPSKDFKVSKYKTHLVRKDDEEKGLEQKVLVTIAIIGLLGSILFFSSNLTGYSIVNFPNKNTSFIGIISLIIGLIAGLIWIKKGIKKTKI